MTKTLWGLAAVMALSAMPLVARADDAAAASPFAFNVGVVTDYRFRGISQTRRQPALQGGADWTLPGGFYVGTWLSTIKWIKDAGGGDNVELDLYGGYKGEIAKDLSFDVGGLAYVYPGAKTSQWDAQYANPDTGEIYGALTYGPVTGKLSYAVTNLFGNYNKDEHKKSRGSYYVELAGNFDVGYGITLTPHVGHQRVEETPNASYSDYSLTAAKEVISGLTVSGSVIGTNANKGFYIPGIYEGSNKFLGSTTVVVGLKYVF